MGKWICEDEAGRVVSFTDTAPGQFVRGFTDLPEVLKRPCCELDVAKLTPALVASVKAAKTQAAAEAAAAAIILGEATSTPVQPLG